MACVLMKTHRRRKRGARGNNLRGGPTYPFGPPNNSPTFFFNFYVKQEKNHKYTKLKGKIIINITFIWFEGNGKTIPLSSSLEFSKISDFKMRNVIIWHWLVKNLVGTWRQNDVDATLLRRIDVIRTSCACWEFGPPPQYSKPSYAYENVKRKLLRNWHNSSQIPTKTPCGKRQHKIIKDIIGGSYMNIHSYGGGHWLGLNTTNNI